MEQTLAAVPVKKTIFCFQCNERREQYFNAGDVERCGRCSSRRVSELEKVDGDWQFPAPSAAFWGFLMRGLSNGNSHQRTIKG